MSLTEIKEKIYKVWCLTINKLHEVHCNFKTVLHDTIIETLGCQKLCAHWMPKMLTHKYKRNQVAPTQAFPKCFEEQCEEFLEY